MFSKFEKLMLFLIVYGMVMKVLWNRLTENTQVNEVILVLFGVSIIIFTMIFEMHKISDDSDQNDEDRR